MFFKKKFLIVVISTFFFTSLALAESNVQFGGYARAGFNLNFSKFNKQYGTNSGQEQTGDKSFSSRHIRNPNFLQLDLKKTFDNGSILAFSIDTEDFQNTYYYNDWSGTSFRVRNAYFDIPASESVSFWAGVRYFPFSDIRLLDYMMEYNAIGAGITIAKKTDLFISLKQKRDKYFDENIKNTPNSPRDVSLVAHSTIDLTPTLSISPEANITRYSSGYHADPNKALLKDEDEIGEVDSHIGYLGRVILGIHTESMWNNFIVSYEKQPENYIDDESVKTLSIGDSGSFTFTDSFGVLVGALVKWEKYSHDIQVYKKGAEEEGKTEKSRIQASIDVQPVYYMTDHVQLALDLNKTIKTKYFSAGEIPEALYITPIVRYSFNKDTIANAQIYTSVTYSKFDYDGVFNGKDVDDTLISMQTGFEIAF